MTQYRVQINDIVERHLPLYVREEFPLVSEFLKQYYKSQEYQGAPTDLLQNIDNYIELDSITQTKDSVVLREDITYGSDVIFIDLVQTPTGTVGFPDSYGLIKINDEIILYENKTFDSFTGCIRGFSGVSSLRDNQNPDQVVFDSTVSEDHLAGSSILNLSNLFLKEFLKKTKHQILPGFEDRSLYSGLNQATLLKQSKDFYKSKGTEESFSILFRALYGEDVKVLNPKEDLFKPSDANYESTLDLVVEPIEGDPLSIINATLYQDEYFDIPKSYAPVAKSRKIDTGGVGDYYRLSIDSGYNRDIGYLGSLYGKFEVHARTYLIEEINSGDTTLNVDSTIGFPDSGFLRVIYDNLVEGTISYESKSINQFYGCSNVTGRLISGSPIDIDTFAYATNVDGDIVKVRITSVLNSLEYDVDQTNAYSIGSDVIIKTLGSNSKNNLTKNWFYNSSQKHEVIDITLLDNSDKTYSITTKYQHFLRIGDSVTITDNTNNSRNSVVTSVLSDRTFSIKGQGEISANGIYTISRNLLKVNSQNFPELSNITSNVQNVYERNDSVLVATNSIPYYFNQPLNANKRIISFSGNFVGSEFQITSNSDHGFYTGEAVYYTPEVSIEVSFIDELIQETRVVNSSIDEEGIYYVKRINSTTIKLSKSKSNLFDGIFISLDNPTQVSNNTLEPYRLNKKTLKPQKFFRQIPTPKETKLSNKTQPGKTGILINGVEILNYKSNETINYGKIESIDVTSPGTDYDIINPPNLIIEDPVGTGATGFCSVIGSLKEIRIVDPGFGFSQPPTINITGGNGSGAKAVSQVSQITHSPFFNSESSDFVSIGATQSTIGFSTYHKFDNGEVVIYKTNGGIAVGGLSTDSRYFTHVIDQHTITLHPNIESSITGINTITLSSLGLGIHNLECIEKKNILSSITILNSGTGYQNKKRTIPLSGISTSTDTFILKRHGFNSGEIVKYTTDGSDIEGLTTNSEYYITKVDGDRFKLSLVGVGETLRSYYYDSSEFIKIEGAGAGLHIFNYPDISVTVSDELSVGQTFYSPVLQPIFRGEISSVHLSDNGVGYGSSEVINFDRQPLIRLVSGSQAQVKPIVSDGKIVEVLVNSRGKNYASPPDLLVSGNGIGAVLSPIIENGELISVKVIHQGIGYSPNSTEIVVVPTGRLAEFRSNIQEWRINLFQKYFNSITNDDGFISESLTKENELQYSHIYAPRNLREIVYSIDQSANILYGSPDLLKVNNSEVNSRYHSPIIGWSYDGYPIYGPYGYSSKSGGVISQMKSGYVLEIKENRPPLSIFPEGFFLQDYTYYKVNDDAVLDEKNGRFCVTPDFPNGTYAYFSTLNLQSDSFGRFAGYKRPAFPYLIGDSYKADPDPFNIASNSNQDNYSLFQTTWLRNTSSYNLNQVEGYEYIKIPSNLNQISKIKFSTPGSIDSVNVVSGGDGYKVKDSIIFDNIETKGFGAEAYVERLFGKTVNSVSAASTIVSGVEVYRGVNKNEYLIESSSPHNFENGDIIYISGISTFSSQINGSYNAGVSTNRLVLKSGIGTIGATGITTFFRVFGSLNYPEINTNDILEIGEEKVKVLNIIPSSSCIRVLRSFNGTVGVSHTATELLNEKSRRLIINSGISTIFTYKNNREIYFDPQETVGLGTQSGVGIGYTLRIYDGTKVFSKFIPTRLLYIPNHGLETGDRLTYFTNGGSPIEVSTNGISTSTSLSNGETLYATKINDELIGISTVKVGLGTTGTFVGITSLTESSTILYITGIGTGSYHSFLTNYPKLTANITKNIVTVSTAQTHGLQKGDEIDIKVISNTTNRIIVKYDDYNRKVIVNPKSFVSAGIDTSTGNINIPSHGFYSGEKVVHSAVSPSIGLRNDYYYYVVVIDSDNIKLSRSYSDSVGVNPKFVGISSASDGVLSPVNPPIEAFKNSTVEFNLSDSSLSYSRQESFYPAFKLEFYSDSNFKDIFEKTESRRQFSVERYGSVGIDSEAKVTLKIEEDFPHNLYYNLVPIYEDDIPLEKTEVSSDTSVLGNNKISIRDSFYSGKRKVRSNTDYTFTYELDEYPESVSYGSTNSFISYDTDSLNSLGPISRIKISNGGKNYYSFPGISTVRSIFGSGAVLDAYGKNIGKVTSTEIVDIGYDFPTDTTIRPSVSFPQHVFIDALSSFESIGISSFGRGYSSAPKLLVFDGKTNEQLEDIDIRYSLGDSSVKILKNTKSLSKITPRILPVNNTNGVGIASISYDSITKDATVRLSVGFSTINSFPFQVGDKVLIENVSVGLNSDGKGYNSANYDYELFTIKSVTQNLGGIGTVSFNMDDFITGSEYPGTFDPDNSIGRIIAEKTFPIFNPVLIQNEFNVGEKVNFGEYNGTVENWNSKINRLTISSKNQIESGDIIVGDSSKSVAIASSIFRYDTSYNVDSLSLVRSGWKTSTGFLNNNQQRMHDNDYYQNFSYSIKSKVPYETWEDAVSTLNHTAGFKKFSDLQIESTVSPENLQAMIVGVSTDVTSCEVVGDLTGFASLHCVYDFDLVKENYVRSGSNVISNEIVFTNRVLTDYFESVGNRVLSIDDISPLFNSNPRPSKFSEVHRFKLDESRSQKHIVYVRDKRYINRRQLMIVSLLHNNSFGFINQYGRVESSYDLGSFDFSIEGGEGLFLFYPLKFAVNDYDVTTLTYNLGDALVSSGGRNLGNIVDLEVANVSVSAGSSSIISIPNSYRSLKVITSIVGENNIYNFNEFNIVHDGSNVSWIQYGDLSTNQVTPYANPGLGTFYPYLSGSQLKVDYTPTVGTASTVNAFYIALTDENSTGTGNYDLKHSRIEARTTSIGSSTSPTSTVVADYIDNYDGAYFIVQITDLTNNIHELAEVCVVDDGSEASISEFARISTAEDSYLGEIGVQRGLITELTFTPEPNIDVMVKVYFNALRYEDDLKDVVSIDNTTIETKYGNYFGTERDIKRSFEVYHQNFPVFQREFLGNESSVIDISEDTLRIPNHFFVTGEKLRYSYAGAGTSQAIGIGATDIPGIGVTSKMPETVYAVKVNENTIKLSRTAEESLLSIPKTLDIIHVGIGTSHTFTTENRNPRVLIALDNIIQSPVVSTALTSSLSVNLTTTEDILYFSGIGSFFGGDLIQIDDEIMKIESVGVGSTNAVRVQRPWLGTSVAGYSTGATIRKVTGSYNIVNNTLNFVEPPYGNLPFSSTTNAPDDRDWVGISTGSNFQGRVFLRSGFPNASYDTYSRNYIFDDISEQFDGTRRSFDLLSNGSNATGFSTENAIILVNDVFQGPGLTYDYTLTENVGITSIRFTGTATSFRSDVNTSNLTVGGIIISVASYEGFGYQPLVSAGGTAIVSIAGTISSISIGNSGSGYRSGIQTVRVGVGTSSTSTPNIEFIGTAVVSNGNIVSIAITNPGSGYTSTNPPYVIIDSPLSYSDIPLVYASGNTGLGTEATVDVVVGNGSSIIDFEIKNLGYGYGQQDVLTIPIGGSTGIPTTSLYQEFQVVVQKTFSDKFTGWSLGELQVLDKFDDLFNGERVVFPLKLGGNFVTIRSSKGSNVNVQDTLLVFVNDILQVPGKAYEFTGGSSLTFTEAPKEGDVSKILFYKGSGSIDVIERNILESVKIGDELTIGYDPSIGQSPILQEEERTVTSINSTDIINTNPYFGPGNVEDNTLTRPVVWCRQTEDKVIDEIEIGKDRIMLEPSVNPYAYIITSVGIGSTTIYVDNLRPFFNPQNENDVTLEFQNKISLVSQEIKVSAAATAIVSSAGTITSIIITDGGIGYDTAPDITIQNPVGLGTTERASAVSTITSTGIVTSITVVDSGTGYSQDNPPLILVAPPVTYEESAIVDEYQGDSGVIVGFGLTTTLGLENQMIFDMFIPTDSYLRSTNVTGTAVTTSNLRRGDYFMVYDSNIGSATTSIISGNLSGGFVAIGTQFVDNVYQVDTAETIDYEVVGVGTTSIRRIFARIIGISSLTFSSTAITFDSGILKFDSTGGISTTTYSGVISDSNYFGNFSWGRINLPFRSRENNYTFYGANGVGGISTSAMVRRYSPLKFTSYIQ